MVVQSNACNSGYVQGTELKFCRVLTWNCCRWTGWERSRWELRKGLEIPDCRAGFRPPRKQKARRRRPLGKKENYQLKRTLCRLTVRGRGCWATEPWLNLGWSTAVLFRGRSTADKLPISGRLYRRQPMSGQSFEVAPIFTQRGEGKPATKMPGNR